MPTRPRHSNGLTAVVPPGHYHNPIWQDAHPEGPCRYLDPFTATRRRKVAHYDTPQSPRSTLHIPTAAVPRRDRHSHTAPDAHDLPPLWHGRPAPHQPW